MTKDKFIRIHKNRGYQIKEFGNMVIISMDNYRAIWFFNADGTRDTTKNPIWKVEKKIKNPLTK